MGAITYAEIVRVAFSPSDMGGVEPEPRMPSSQPVHHISPLLYCQANMYFAQVLARDASSRCVPRITRPTPISV